MSWTERVSKQEVSKKNVGKSTRIHIITMKQFNFLLTHKKGEVHEKQNSHEIYRD